MAEEPKGDDKKLTEALRSAIERTLDATAGSAAETRGRAADVVDQVARRGDDARREMARRGQDAREASAALTSKVVEAIEGMRLARGDEVRELGDRLDGLEKRLAEIERGLGGSGKESGRGPKGKGKVEG